MDDVTSRRRALVVGLAAATSPLALAATRAAAEASGLPEARGRTYVLVHGS
jgi:hypothetical protein